MRLPDPFTPNLKVDLLADINNVPKINPEYFALLNEKSLTKKIDSYLMNKTPNDLPSVLLSIIMSSNNNYSLINSIILYIGKHLCSITYYL